ncbi:MAG TPA: hypothetical protein VL287_19065 [Gemmatimonadales bacterium]|nr:hypothetical protein [Gemmatimonadales bacterium]
MRTFAALGVIAVILTLINVIALLAAATATDMDPRTRLLMLSGSLAGMSLFATLTALLFRKASA